MQTHALGTNSWSCDTGQLLPMLLSGWLESIGSLRLSDGCLQDADSDKSQSIQWLRCLGDAGYGILYGSYRRGSSAPLIALMQISSLGQQLSSMSTNFTLVLARDPRRRDAGAPSWRHKNYSWVPQLCQVHPYVVQTLRPPHRCRPAGIPTPITCWPSIQCPRLITCHPVSPAAYVYGSCPFFYASHLSPHPYAHVK